MGCGAITGVQEVLTPQLQFRKVKSIIQNGDTEIWTCQNKTNQKFSVKVFKKIFITPENQYMLRNFQQEVNRLHSLTEGKSTNSKGQTDAGSHLMPYLRAWKDENCNLSLIMKYIEESSLGDEVKGKLPGLFTQALVANLTEQILRTIKYLRKNGSIFCNFKPTNVFLDKKRQNVIITDYFNLEEYFNLNQKNILNNPIYSAPENVLFNQYFQETDIWRVGCFVIEMLTCIKPWYKETINNQKIIQNLKNRCKPPIPDKVSNACKNFIEKCFETDHNRRTSLEQLLNHEFITKTKSKSPSLIPVQSQKTYERENISIEEIASYNFEIQLIEQPPAKRYSKQSRNRQSGRVNFEQLSPTRNIMEMTISRKKTNSNCMSEKKYETSKIISRIDENTEQSTIEMKKSRNFRSKRIKTEGPQRNYVSNSPYSKQNNQKEILHRLNKKKSINIGNTNTSSFQNNMSVSRKVSKTSNFQVDKSKKRLPTNQIMLNNKAVTFNDNSSSRYWPAPQVPAPFNYLQAAEKLSNVMRQIQKSGGEKYYKKPLKLLKQKMRDKTSLRTETSITLQDSRALLQRSEDDIEEIDFETSNNFTTDQLPNQSLMSNRSRYPGYQNVAIETQVSKAYKQRLQSEYKMLKEQRETDKVKWERQLKEGRQFIKKQINKRYLSINNIKSRNPDTSSNC